MQHLLFVLGVCLLVGCGGGGGSSRPEQPTSTPPPTTPPTATPAPAQPSAAAMDAAAKLLTISTFGPTFDEIEDAAMLSEGAWLDTQLSLPPSRHLPIVIRYLSELGFDPTANPSPALYRRFAFWEQSLTGPDQLRQVVAYALTQIFVVSDNVENIAIDPRALASYTDLLLEHSFGNYRDILREVTLHPAMGVYLSHVNNGKSDAVANTFPDENYAREVMQLFSIGLFMLNADGSQVQDSIGNPIPTYDNADIREFAKIFTGLSYGSEVAGTTGSFGNQNRVMYRPMQMFEDFHEPGAKRLLNGVIVPSGKTGMEDIEAAIDNLFGHPNVGPFIGKQLIQRLVTSNPSADYVSRVTAVFNDNGAGVRGDMAAVLRTILTDSEVASAIRLREPFRRYVALNRSLGAMGEDGSYTGLGLIGQFLTGQFVLSAPSVFNFYSPAFAPAGEIKNTQLVAPEFQITDASTVIGVTNLVAYALYSEQSIDSPDGFSRIVPDLRPYEAIAEDSDALVERIDLVFFAGGMDAETRTVLTEAAASVYQSTSDRSQTARVALYLALISPAQAVFGAEL